MDKGHRLRIQPIIDRMTNLPVSGRFNWISAFALLAIIALVAANIVGRAAFNSPIAGTYELSQFLMVIVVFTAISYTQVRKGHIALEILVKRFPVKVRAILQSVTLVVGIVLFALMSWRSIMYGVRLLEGHETSMVLKIPQGPFLFMVAFGCILFCVVLLAQFIESLGMLKK